MELIDLTVDVMRGITDAQAACQVVAGHMEDVCDDPFELRKARCTMRFLKRWRQYRAGVISEGDLLAALRDFTLFLGRVTVPQEVVKLIWRGGEAFGLSMEAGQYARASVGGLGWFPDESFVKQAYGLQDAQPILSSASIGDAWLWHHTGYAQYRSFEQKTAVHTVLNMPDGCTLLLSLPTGAGKSLVGQMLACACEGLTLVVVPTTALGKDQERATRTVMRNVLEPEAIESYCGDSAAGKLTSMLNKIAMRKLRCLITSPEAIVKNEALHIALAQAADEGFLRHMVIDEAHIIQDWGALFRPDFQFLAVVRQEFLERSGNTLKTVLLSATLTEEAVLQLKELFSNGGAWIELRCDALRKEPRFLVDTPNDAASLTKRVVHYARTLPKPMLIYCIRPGEAQMWKERLAKIGLKNIVTFTGLTDDEQRGKIIKRWNEDDLDIIIATSAFGMGIDKPDVRTVMHVTLPENVNRFYQEVGRAGRDGLPCLSMLCYCPRIAAGVQHKIVNTKVLKVENMLDRWFSMLNNENTERDADIVLIDTMLAPAYFTEQEREQRGVRNRDWNIHVILFFIRNSLLHFINMAYDAPTRKYLIRVKLMDVDLMNDRERLQARLEPLRQWEMESAQNGYRTLQEMVRAGKRSCFATSFAQLFPYAALSCGGCPSHGDAYSDNGEFMLHNHVSTYGEVNRKTPNNALWGGMNALLVTRRENARFSADRACAIAKAMNAMGIGVWITSRCGSQQAQQFQGIVLTLTEAEWLASHHSSLLYPGAIISFGDDPRENQRLYHLAVQIKEFGAPVAYHVRAREWIGSASRSISHLLNARIISEDEIMEVPNVPIWTRYDYPGAHA